MTTIGRAIGVGSLAALVAAVAIPAAAGQGATRLVSQTSGGDPANGNSFDGGVSGSGRYVSFESEADNLPGDAGFSNVYVHDRQTGNTRLISKTSGGDPATDGNSDDPSISANGRFVAFESAADNLPGPNYPADDFMNNVYLHDRQTGNTRLISRTPGGDPADGDNNDPFIGGAGRFVGFESGADNMPGRNFPGDDFATNVYLFDRETGTTRLISKTSGGDPADGDAEDATVTPNGRFVGFESGADNLPGRNYPSDDSDNVYLHDRQTGRTMLISKTSSGQPAGPTNHDPFPSATGRYVSFESSANNLPGPDFPGEEFDNNVYVHDRQTGNTRVVSRTSQGDPADGSSQDASLSPNARYVAFESAADNLPGRNFPGQFATNVYLHDRQTGATRLVSQTSGGDPADASSGVASAQRILTPDGGVVAFNSLAANLPGDDAYEDVYVRLLGT
jgi:Tol biopolymer transport system component